MPWLSIALEVEEGSADALSDALLEAGAESVSLEGVRVSALIDPGKDVEALLQSVGIAASDVSVHRIEDRDWVLATQAQFPPLPVGNRLWIGASWHEPPRDRVVVRIDPGLAFGTGSHPSTRLVLAFLEKHIHGGERVLDYGCGSGILAIAAAGLGAAHVDAVDLDPQAVETTAANAQANGARVNATLPDALPTATYDLVVANILSQTLIVLAPLLTERTARGGQVVLSGILSSQAAEVADAYRHSFQTRTAAHEEGWALVVGRRP